MAKKSLVIKAKRKQKFKVREYTVVKDVEEQDLFYVNLVYVVYASEN